MVELTKRGGTVQRDLDSGRMGQEALNTTANGQPDACRAVTTSSVLAGRVVLVTGAGGFVGGHVARQLAQAGYGVRGLVRRLPQVEEGDPPIDWVIGDLRDPDLRARAVAGAWGVVHCGGWVNLGVDARGEARAINVEATSGLVEQCVAAGVERFIYTSTLQTIAAGSVSQPADEESTWNLDTVESPYVRSKREIEEILLSQGERLPTLVICPGMVIGPRDPRPTSTRVLMEMARTPLAFLPAGGIPVIDAQVLAQAHQQALESDLLGERLALVGPYLSFRDQARLVARLTGWPRWVVAMPDLLEKPLTRLAGGLDRLLGGRVEAVSAATVAGGFLRFHVKGDRADRMFNLKHPPPIRSIYDALADLRRSGRAPWVRFKKEAHDLEHDSLSIVSSGASEGQA